MEALSVYAVFVGSRLVHEAHPRREVWGNAPLMKCLEFRTSEITSARFLRRHTANIGLAVAGSAGPVRRL